MIHTTAPSRSMKSTESVQSTRLMHSREFISPYQNRTATKPAVAKTIKSSQVKQASSSSSSWLDDKMFDSFISNIMMIFLLAAVLPAILNQKNSIGQGVTETYDLTAGSAESYIDPPNSPWLYCQVINSSLTDVMYVSVNDSTHYTTIDKNANLIIDRITTTDKIVRLYYKADSGITVAFRAIGEY